MNLNEIRELAEIMSDTGLRRLSVTEEGRTIELEKALHEKTTVETIEASEFTLSRQESLELNVSAVTAPMVGVFYSAPSPETNPFVSKGDNVKRGDVLCIIEAMKLMNEITAEQDGTISEICAQNGQIVEFGQTLFRIK